MEEPSTTGRSPIEGSIVFFKWSSICSRMAAEFFCIPARYALPDPRVKGACQRKENVISCESVPHDPTRNAFLDPPSDLGCRWHRCCKAGHATHVAAIALDGGVVAVSGLVSRRDGRALIVAYLRVSTNEQHLGPEAQRAAILRWSEAAGVEVSAWHEDRGVSGNRRWDRRPGLVAAIEEARGGVLVVAKRDRLARGLETMIPLEAELRRRRIQIRSAAGEGTDGDESQHRLHRGMLDVVSGFELARISERIKAALAVKKARGEPYTAIPPYGWRRVQVEGREVLQEEPTEQEAIQFIREQRARGRSLRAIARACELRGYKGRGGGPLYLSRIAAILRRTS